MSVPTAQRDSILSVVKRGVEGGRVAMQELPPNLRVESIGPLKVLGVRNDIAKCPVVVLDAKQTGTARRTRRERGQSPRAPQAPAFAVLFREPTQAERMPFGPNVGTLVTVELLIPKPGGFDLSGVAQTYVII